MLRSSGVFTPLYDTDNIMCEYLTPYEINTLRFINSQTYHKYDIKTYTYCNNDGIYKIIAYNNIWSMIVLLFQTKTKEMYVIKQLIFQNLNNQTIVRYNGGQHINVNNRLLLSELYYFILFSEMTYKNESTCSLDFST